MNKIKSAVVGVVAAAFVSASLVMPAQAAMVGTEQLLQQAPQSDARARVQAFLQRAEVQQQLQHWGVAAQDAQSRVDSLSDAEIAQLSQRIDQLPAGAGALEVIGVVFLVLLILELVGVINIFNRI